MNCTQFPLRPESVVAVARDTYLTPRLAFPDPANLPGADAPKYGQDITSSYGRTAPKGQSVGSSPAELIPKMRKLLDIFAKGDRAGMATRLFNAFLARSSQVRFFDDPALNAAVAQHSNANAFCAAAMSIPGPPPVIWGRGGGRPPPHKKRIHEALKDASWDIGKMVAPSDLGVPAFNIGSPTLSTEDFNNGLGLMSTGYNMSTPLPRITDTIQRQERIALACGSSSMTCLVSTTTISANTEHRPLHPIRPPLG